MFAFRPLALVCLVLPCVVSAQDSTRQFEFTIHPSIGGAHIYAEFNDDDGAPPEASDAADQTKNGMVLACEVGLVSTSANAGVALLYHGYSATGKADPFTVTVTNLLGETETDHFTRYDHELDISYYGIGVIANAPMSNPKIHWTGIAAIGLLNGDQDVHIEADYVSSGLGGGQVSTVVGIHAEGVGLLLGTGLDFQVSHQVYIGAEVRMLTGKVETKSASIGGRDIDVDDGSKSSIDHIGIQGGLRFLL